MIMAAYLGGNIYLFIRTLQQISSLPLVWKILFGIIFWVVAISMFLSIGMRNVEIPPTLSRLMFQAGSAWMIFILYMVLGRRNKKASVPAWDESKLPRYHPN
jgi:hypothetical protein